MRSHRMLTLGAIFAVCLVGLSACGSDDTDTATDQSVEESAETTGPAPGPRSGATYVGTIEGEPGLAGEVTLVVAESGEELTELNLDLDLTEYACAGGSTLSGGLGLGVGFSVPIIDDTFELSSESAVWEGTFESELTATGTVQGNIQGAPGGPPCEVGPFPWTAELE